MRPFVVGTAGHIDHGKSALVEALTGVHPDRLPEEKRRGITIELGFAHAEVAPGIVASFVDVPGHEKFVRTMVAGAQGVDVALLVVALDEGVMPQTREHAEVCRLLGIERAIVAVTKDDLAPGLDPAWPALVEAEIRALGEPFASAPLVRVSARARTGLETLRAQLAEVVTQLPERVADVPAFLPIDRVFTLKGHGTIVAGTLHAGRIATDDLLALVMPHPRTASIRGGLRARTLQTHGRLVSSASAGQRVAVNLPGVEVQDVERGSALVGSETAALREGALLDVELELVARAGPLANRSKVSLLLGTAQALATVDLMGLAELEPGRRCVAQLRLDRALPVLRGERFVLRGYRALSGGGQTVAGGRVLLRGSSRRRAADRSFVQALAGSLAEAAHAIVRRAGPSGVEKASLAVLLRAHVLPSLPGVVERGGVLFLDEVGRALGERLTALVKARGPIGREEARVALGRDVGMGAFELALGMLGEEFVVGEMLSPAARRRSPLEEAVRARLVAAGLMPPTAAELATLLRADKHAVGGAVRALARDGLAVRLTDELFVDAGAAEAFRARVVAALVERGSLTTLELKELSGASRKYAIPLCEWLDQTHVTLRVGEHRTLRKAVRS